ncbi:MAG TPA: thiamine-phosphate kinase, partial [Armatimonadota bacterium]
MKLSEIGEEALIERISKLNALPQSAPGLIVGVGDDAAVLAPDTDGKLTLVTTDMLTENVDFKLDLITPYQLGWKSAAVNISDIAAMGGDPTWTFPSLGFRPDTEVEFVDDFYRGMSDCASRFGSIIAGGDMNSLDGDYVISLTQLGKVSPDRLALRSKGRAGDQILVTGWLGNS